MKTKKSKQKVVEDLIQALKVLQIDLENDGEVLRSDERRITLIRKAIAKAEGK